MLWAAATGVIQAFMPRKRSNNLSAALSWSYLMVQVVALLPEIPVRLWFGFRPEWLDGISNSSLSDFEYGTLPIIIAVKMLEVSWIWPYAIEASTC